VPGKLWCVTRVTQWIETCNKVCNFKVVSW